MTNYSCKKFPPNTKRNTSTIPQYIRYRQTDRRWKTTMRRQWCHRYLQCSCSAWKWDLRSTGLTQAMLH